jgi:hypothetical protein
MCRRSAISQTLLAAATWIVLVAPCVMAQQGSAAPVAAYRGRLLGVYDGETGNPVEGVRVSDVLSGTSAMTTATGTVSLAFVPDGGGLVRLQRLGYETQTTFVSISPREAGYFLDEDVLRKNENRSLANVMRARMPGAQFHDGNNGSVVDARAVNLPIFGENALPALAQF